MIKCAQGPCFYLHLDIDHKNKTVRKTTCDFKDGEEIKNIPKEELENCPSYKTEKEMRERYRKY
ncbi:MAG: hypothetical protein WDA59_04250 [Methanofastidiosum sp.]